MKILSGVPFTDVDIDDAFFSPKLAVYCTATIRACLDKCKETGRISNFAKAAGLAEGEFEGKFYNDSDVYKILEGVAYVLHLTKDKALEREADGIIDLIAAAQQPDGYIHSYFTLVEPDGKWKKIRMHEAYCFGHLIEAGVAYKRATGKTKLFDVGRRAADHMDAVFGPGKREWIPGHQEIELALVKLYRETGEAKYLKLAEFLLEQRGTGRGIDVVEENRRGEGYNQDHLPVSQQKDVKGHAVRAMYMYCGMADVAMETGNQAYFDAIAALWDSAVNRNMYITGGIGAQGGNEGFGGDYNLPVDSNYCETCANIGMAYWNRRINLYDVNGKYADIVEKELYNGALSGVSLSGDRFFYGNPLESAGEKQRSAWFACSCCPSQLARYLPSIGDYIYMTDGVDITINQFISNNAKIAMKDWQVPVSIKGRYPFDGAVSIRVDAPGGEKFAVRIRIPGWCRSYSVAIDGKAEFNYRIIDGYLVLTGAWNGKTIDMNFDMPVEINMPHPKVAEQVPANAGRAAVTRGPLVYCFEDCDNPLYNEMFLHPGAVGVIRHRDDLLGGVDVIDFNAPSGGRFRAVPYFAWNNREQGRMKVWLEYRG